MGPTDDSRQKCLRARSIGSHMRTDVMKKMRFGVFSTACIGVQKVSPAMQKGEPTLGHDSATNNESNGGAPCCQTNLDPSSKRHYQPSARTSRKSPSAFI